MKTNPVVLVIVDSAHSDEFVAPVGAQITRSASIPAASRSRLDVRTHYQVRLKLGKLTFS